MSANMGTMVTVRLPVSSMSAQEGTVVEWLCREGDAVTAGEPLVTVETEKAVTEVPAPVSGRLVRILVEAGRAVPVRTPLAEIAVDTEAANAGTSLAPVTAPASTEQRRAGTPERAPGGPPAGSSKPQTMRVIATPLARKIAGARGINLADVAGSGPNGRILARDVPEALEVAPMSEELLVSLGPVRRTTAERMSLSARTVARVTLLSETDFSEAERMRRQLSTEFERRWQAQLSYDAMIAKAAARALVRHPDANSHWADGALRRGAGINVGVAIQTPRGLLVPVIRHADQLPLPVLARELRRLLDGALAGRLTSDDLSGGTFTITNLGPFGVDAFTPIVNPPEAAILGVGRIADRPVRVDGNLEWRRIATLSLAFDHRVLDGVPAAEFLNVVREGIEQPYLLLTD